MNITPHGGVLISDGQMEIVTASTLEFLDGSFHADSEVWEPPGASGQPRQIDGSHQWPLVLTSQASLPTAACLMLLWSLVSVVTSFNSPVCTRE